MPPHDSTLLVKEEHSWQRMTDVMMSRPDWIDADGHTEHWRACSGAPFPPAGAARYPAAYLLGSGRPSAACPGHPSLLLLLSALPLPAGQVTDMVTLHGNFTKREEEDGQEGSEAESMQPASDTRPELVQADAERQPHMWQHPLRRMNPTHFRALSRDSCGVHTSLLLNSSMVMLAQAKIAVLLM